MGHHALPLRACGLLGMRADSVRLGCERPGGAARAGTATMAASTMNGFIENSLLLLATHERIDEIGNLIGGGIERKMTSLEHVNVGLRNVAAIGLGFGDI